MAKKKIRVGLKEVMATLDEFNLIRIEQMGVLLDTRELDHSAIERVAIERQLINQLKGRFESMEDEENGNE
jgi:hypothetical protein